MRATFSFGIPAALRPGVAGTRRLLYGLFFLAGVAQAAIVPLLPRLSSTYGLSGAQTGLLLALPGLATMAVSVPAGMAADRFGSRRVSLAAGLLLGVSCLLHGVPSLAALLLGRIGFGIAYGVVWTTAVSWLADLHSGAGSPRLGASTTFSSVGIMAGPAIGGLLAELAGVGLPFLLIGGTTFVLMAGLALSGGGARRAPGSAPATSPRALLG
ncbi:MAG: MFS transporter, partial [Solirubrobacteraceae bacterium]